MNIVLNRQAGVAVKEQLIAHIEMQILGGELAAGQKLPSVRALARRVQLHPNTISAAYGELEAAGRVRLKRGSGVYVEERGSERPEDANGLDEMVRVALHRAFHAGHSGGEIRAAVERWLGANPPQRIVVVEPDLALAELLAAELRATSNATVRVVGPDEVKRNPDVLSGALVMCLPYHVETVRRHAPNAAIEEVNLVISELVREQIAALAPGSIVLFVSSTPTVRRFASVILRSLRGDELVIEVRDLAAVGRWQRLVRVADLVITDLLARPAVCTEGPRRLLEVRLTKPTTADRTRDAN